MRVFVLAIILALTALGRSASAPVMGPTGGHRINADTKGCRTLELFQRLISAAVLQDVETWDATLRSGFCTSFHRGDRVILDPQQIKVKGVIKIHRINAALGYFTFALVVD